jgi:tRNA(fMet)-specific endonuclease VapC
MVNLFIDTSVLIEEIRKGSELWSEVKDLSKSNKVSIISSVIVLTELWMGESMSKKEKLNVVEEMVEVITFVDVNNKLAKMAGELIRKYKVIGFDGIIAATAMEYNAELVTLNIKHFKNIKGLKLYNENL